MSEVFISYKQDEREKMRPIAAALRALQVEVWFDERLSPDKPFTEEIEHVANNCRAQLVCWSPAAVKSEWVRGEAEIGRQRGTLVQAIIEPCTLSPPFNVIHAENIAEWTGQPQHHGFQKLVDTIGRKIGRPGLAELALIQGSPVADDWKKWASKYPSDPLAEEAWAKAEDLHLNSEKDRMKKEWQSARKKAEEEEARRKAAEEARRRTPPPAPAAAPAYHELHNPPPRRGLTPGMIALLVLTLGLAGGTAAFGPQMMAAFERPDSELTPEVATFARDLEGSWRFDGATDCSAPYVVRIEGAELLLIGPDGSPQRETIQGVSEGWLHTEGANAVSSYFQRRGRVLAYRFADINDDAGESRFERCSDTETAADAVSNATDDNPNTRP